MNADLAGEGGRWWGGPTHAVAAATSTDVMNQLCRVCGEPAAGFHFGAFTCEGCKSFFGRTYNNLSSISECKNNGGCVINKKNRTSCKACRLRKCLMVGMSKSGSRYGRRSNWFKIHCLLQEQQQQSQQHQQYQQQHHQHNKNKPWDTGPPPLSKTLENNNNHLVKHPMGLLSPHPGFPNQSDAAAFWAARASLMHPLGGHPPSLPPLPMPFLAPPSFLSAAAYRPPPRPLLLPFVHSTPHPSTSSTSTASSASSSPSERPPPSGEAALRALGPVQEQPIDLSLGGGAGERQDVAERSEQSDSSEESEPEQIEDENEHSKATTPLDLTFKT